MEIHEIHRCMAAAGAGMTRVVRGVRPDQLDTPTPCPDFDVRALVYHLLTWAPPMEAAARRQPAPPPQEDDPTGGDWQSRYLGHIAGMVDAWSDPQAWNGEVTFLDRPFPAQMLGAMSFTELVVHAWDLALATGQEYSCDDDVAEALHLVMSLLGERGRAMGAFGDEVEVALDAPPLDRALGLAGRDPGWSVGPTRTGASDGR